MSMCLVCLVSCVFQVLQYEADDGEAEAIVFSVWDYAGQDVFHALHSLFLTRFGVYLVTFSMVEMVEHQVDTVGNLRHWLHSIAVHARGPEGDTPPVILVGTHKDKVLSSFLSLPSHLALSLLWLSNSLPFPFPRFGVTFCSNDMFLPVSALLCLLADWTAGGP